MQYLTNRRMPLIMLGIISTTSVALAEDMTINRLLASQCAQCHGTYGRAVGDIDSLAGENDLYEEVMEMRREDRPDDIMDHQALGYTEDQIRRIAAYYGTISESGNSGNGSGGSGSSGDSNSEGEKKKRDRHRDRDKKRDRKRDRDRGDD